VKELEARGVGRPSTYASIIDTILRRNYVQKSGKALVPTFMAFGVIQLLEKHFTHLVDMEFTAEMEEILDEISRGERGRVDYLKDFYFGVINTLVWLICLSRKLMQKLFVQYRLRSLINLELS
jgi:DNA topoisomerase-1